MEIKELRFGNIINLINIGQCSIVALERFDNNVLPVVCNEKREFKVNQNIIEPIPLTEEWLLKFGFSKKENKEYWFKEDSMIRFALLDNVLHCSIGDDEYGILYNRLKYVHQLQNLFFALTNKELTIN